MLPPLVVENDPTTPTSSELSVVKVEAAAHESADTAVQSAPDPLPAAAPSAASEVAVVVAHKEGANAGGKGRWACPIDGCENSYQCVAILFGNLYWTHNSLSTLSRFKNDLKYHLKKKHPEAKELALTIARDKSSKVGKKFPCPFGDCTSGFNWARDLRRHLSLRHARDGCAFEPQDMGNANRSSHRKTFDDWEEKHDSLELPMTMEEMLLNGSLDQLPQSFI